MIGIFANNMKIHDHIDRKRCTSTHKYPIFIHILFDNFSAQDRLNNMLPLKSFF